MKKLFYLLLFVLFGSVNLVAQEGPHYVSGSSLNVRSEPNTNSEVITKLDRYDNLEVVETNDNWSKVVFDNQEGYVYADYIKEGEAVVSTYQVRTGAVCKDGSSSTATGRGACSHHGGVRYWKTETKQNVRIVN